MNPDLPQPTTRENAIDGIVAETSDSPRAIPAWLLATVLALVTVVVYWPATGFEFVNFDDPQCLTENPHVQNGLNGDAIRWAFTSTRQHGYWAPVLWLSHTLAWQLFGPDPRGHHLINILLHGANAGLVFLLFYRMTGAGWRCLLLAAFFAWHPLRVESVAWVTERKDVLSGFFGLLTLIAYTRYARSVTSDKWQVTSDPSVPASPVTRHPSQFYGLALLCFTLGLMSKPMLVTLPFVMWLLDYWPLGRFTMGERRLTSFRSYLSIFTRHSLLVWEKIPFLTLAALAGALTFLAQRQAGAVLSLQSLPLGSRIANALVSYCRYLGKSFYPADLAVIYPLSGSLPWREVLMAAVLLCGLTIVLFRMRHKWPYLLVGWLWFLGMLMPVIGLSQAGGQAMADRFTYLPSLGFLILLIWAVSEWTQNWRKRLTISSAVSVAGVISCIVLTRHQLTYWQNSETLFRHALAITDGNYVAHCNLGEALATKGRTDEAIFHFQEAIRIYHDYPDAQNNLGILLGGKGQIDEAIRHFAEAVRIKPDYAEARYDLGVALDMKGHFSEAIPHFQEAIRIKPDFAEAENNLGVALGSVGRIDEAIRHFQAAIRLKPDYAEAKNNLARALGMKSSPASR